MHRRTNKNKEKFITKERNIGTLVYIKLALRRTHKETNSDAGKI